MSVNETFDSEPPSSNSMWANMFGLGPLFRMASDPQMQAACMGMMQAIASGATINARMEAKLDFLIRKAGYDPSEIARSAESEGRSGPPFLLAGNGAGGAGTSATTCGAAHNGAGPAAPVDPPHAASTAPLGG